MTFGDVYQTANAAANTIQAPAANTIRAPAANTLHAPAANTKTAAAAQLSLENAKAEHQSVEVDSVSGAGAADGKFGKRFFCLIRSRANQSAKPAPRQALIAARGGTSKDHA